MHVAYDHQVFAFQQYGGISRYFVRLIEGLLSRGDCSVSVTAPLHVNAYLDDLPPSVIRGSRISPKPIHRTLSRHVGKHLAPLLIARDRPTLVHETYFARNGSAPRGVPTVLTVYDMIHERLPQYFAATDPTRDLKRQAVLRADLILCISESTRQDLIEFLPEAESKAVVTLLGFDRLDDTGASTHAGRPYCLYVGERGGYKNFEGFLRAFASSPRLVRDFGIRCFGGGPLRDSERALAAELGVPQESLMFTTGDDRMLADAYRHAAAFVYPSLYEGFGIPPLEAMALSCPVAASARSSIPEVCGDAAAYFDPQDIGSMASVLEELLYDNDVRATLVARGHRWLGTYSWDRCTTETLQAYRRLV